MIRSGDYDVRTYQKEVMMRALIKSDTIEVRDSLGGFKLHNAFVQAAAGGGSLE